MVSCNWAVCYYSGCYCGKNECFHGSMKRQWHVPCRWVGFGQVWPNTMPLAVGRKCWSAAVNRLQLGDALTTVLGIVVCSSFIRLFTKVLQSTATEGHCECAVHGQDTWGHAELHRMSTARYWYSCTNSWRYITKGCGWIFGYRCFGLEEEAGIILNITFGKSLFVYKSRTSWLEVKKKILEESKATPSYIFVLWTRHIWILENWINIFENLCIIPAALPRASLLSPSLLVECHLVFRLSVCSTSWGVTGEHEGPRCASLPANYSEILVLFCQPHLDKSQKCP